ncbi:MAG: 2-C-methyl-D-erythritol 4-phosphate cytidylyltransferase [Gammaproteobacteria bacterium]
MADTQPSGRYFLVLPAAGSGRRMQAGLPKQYLALAGRSLLQHSLERLGALPEIERIVVALASDDARWPALQAALPQAVASKVSTVTGGAERMQSVANALAALQPHAAANDWVLVHDAVRPCVHPSDVRRLMRETANDAAGGLLGLPVRETLKECDGEQRFVARTVDRSHIWQAATPQIFRFAVLQRALHHAAQLPAPVTDEAGAVEALGMPVRLVAGRADNLKITYPGDLALAAAVLDAQVREFSGPDADKIANERADT